MIKVLMVCLGNICRSPLAQVILESKFKDDTIFVDSAGTSGHHNGELPDLRSIKVAQKNNMDITLQRSRKFALSDFITFDYIYAMDIANYNDIVALSRNEKESKKVKLILNEISSTESLEVPDPYYGGENGFDNVFNMLDIACDIIASNIKKNER